MPYDAGIAAYFEQVFLYDWDRARQRLEYEAAMPLIASESETVPEGYTSVTWSAVYDGVH